MAIKTFSPMRYTTLLAAVCLLIAGNADATPRSRMFEVARGVQIHFLEDGNPSRQPTLVFIPGWRCTASIWSHQLQAFSREQRVIAIDPRSQGNSTKTDEGDTPEQRARDYRLLLTSLHLEPVILVGWSQGVQDVAAYVDQYGTNGVKAVVLVDSTISGGASNIPVTLQFAVRQLQLLALFADSPREYTEGMIRAIISKPLSEAALNDLVSGALETPTATAEAMLVADLFGKDRTSAIGKFRVPTLVIASARSEELAEQRELASKLPQGRIEVVDQSAHAVFIDQPERFEAILRDFVKRGS